MAAQVHPKRKTDIINEVLNASTHGVATILSMVGLVFLIMKGQNTGSDSAVISYVIYGISMILLFLASTLYHSFSFTRFKRIFRYVDHASIYLLIAGSYTPFCLISLNNTAGYLLLGILWFIALLGIILKIFFVGKYNGLSTVLYLAMGWLAIFLIKPIYQSIGTNGLILLFLGGLSYSIGTIFYSNKKFGFMHVIWHLFVMAGAGFIYFSILYYV